MSGLVAHYPLHESSGRANDVSGNGNHGTVNGATQGVWGRGGLTAYSFNGVDDNIEISGIKNEVSDIYTISAWVKLDSPTSSIDGIVGPINGSRFSGRIYINDGSPLFDVDDSGGTQYILTGNSVNANEWVHLTAIRSESGMLLYQNGSVVNSNNYTGTEKTGSGTGYIGLAQKNGYMNGSIADIRVYNRVLSPQEIQTLYEWGSEDYTDQSLHDGTDSGAVSRYTFDGNVTTDSWGSNTLTDNTSAGTTTDAIRGDAKSFDGTDDYMDMPSLSSLSAYTISFWSKFNSVTDSDDDIVLYLVDNNGVIISQDSDDTVRVDHQDGSSNFQFVDKAVESDVYHHWCGSWDGSVVQLYQNGVEVDSTQASGMTAVNSSNNIGRASDTTDRYLDGDIDDLRIYDRALSDREVFDLYRWGARGKDMRKELVTK